MDARVKPGHDAEYIACVSLQHRAAMPSVAGNIAMPLEHEMAEPLTGHHFFLHADNPSLGILRLRKIAQPSRCLAARNYAVRIAQMLGKLAR